MGGMEGKGAMVGGTMGPGFSRLRIGDRAGL